MIARFAIPFFFLMGVIVAPLLVALLCRVFLPRRFRKWAIIACTLLIWGVLAYGHFVSFEQLEIRQIEYASSDLPASFDGYRIVHFSDAHVGTLTGRRQWMVQRMVDSINALRPDVIVFTGDLQNIYPDELSPHIPVLRQLHAKDGVFSVLGNHDYDIYQSCDDAQKEKNCRKTIEAERQAGWQLLLNEHRWLYRGGDSICLAGMENRGVAKRMPRLGDVRQTLEGVSDSAFVVMLQHDPSSWREQILPECQAQLTLSGHTHGGQAQLFGWSPVELNYSEWGGMTYEGSRAIYVSTGVGALIPFRLNQTGEIAVITLKKCK